MDNWNNCNLVSQYFDYLWKQFTLEISISLFSSSQTVLLASCFSLPKNSSFQQHLTQPPPTYLYPLSPGPLTLPPVLILSPYSVENLALVSLLYAATSRSCVRAVILLLGLKRLRKALLSTVPTLMSSFSALEDISFCLNQYNGRRKTCK